VGSSTSTSRLARRTFVAAPLALLLLALCAARAWAAPTWLSPVNLSAPGQNAVVPQVAMNQGGNAVAVWRRSDGTNTRVQAAVRPAGGSFSAPVNISAAGQDANSPQVAIDQAGDAVAVWTRSDGANVRIQTASRPAGGSFSAPVNISAAGQDAFNPQVAMNQGGDAVAVWRRSDGSNDRVQAASRAAGGGFSAPVNLSVAGKDTHDPQVAIDEPGDAVAVWTRFDGANDRVQAASRAGGGGFSAPDNLSAAGQTAFNPQVAMDQGGGAVAVWERFDGANERVQAAIRPSGGAFSAPVNLSAAGQPAGNAQVAIDAGGDAVAVWQRFNGANNIVQAAIRSAGGAFSAPVNLSATGRDAFDSQVAMDQGGDAVAVWSRFVGGDVRVQAANRPAGGGFSAEANLSAAGEDATLPQVAMDQAGDALAAWSRFNGANLIAQAAGFDAVGPQLRNLSVPGSGSTGSPVSFSVSPFDVWGPVSTGWSFGDGASASGRSVSHTFCSGGTRQVKVTATDAAGNATSATRSISIAASNAFGFGEVTKNKKKGTAQIAVELPGAGTLELAKTKKVKGASAEATCNGEESVLVKARGKTKRKLKKKGKAKVKAKVSFTPTGGSPSTESTKIKLKRKKKH
jgi:PKD repeat protein